MAFNFTTVSPTRVQAVGSMTPLMMGVATLSGGTVTVTLPTNLRVRAAAAWSNSSTNATYVSATSGSALTITGNGSDQVTWLAMVDGGV